MGSSSLRWLAVAGFVTLAVFCALYRLLVFEQAEQTVLLFVGLPAWLGVMVALTPPARSATGVALQIVTLALLLSGVLLGEGFVCILMAAPLFYGIALSIGILVDIGNGRAPWSTGPRATHARPRNLLAVLPALLLLLEERIEGFSFPRDDEVTVTVSVASSPEEVEKTLSQQPKLQNMHLPMYLSLGFPKPVAIEQTGITLGDEMVIHWDIGDVHPRFQRFRVTERGPQRVLLSLVEDSSPIAHWLTWTEKEITWEAAPDGTTRVSWTNRWRRALDPGWYFGPAERLAMRQATSVQLAVTVVPHTGG